MKSFSQIFYISGLRKLYVPFDHHKPTYYLLWTLTPFFSILYLISTILLDTTIHIRGLVILKLSESFILPTCNFVCCVPVQVGCVWVRMCERAGYLFDFLYISDIMWGDLTHYQLFLYLLYRDVRNNPENIFLNNMHNVSYTWNKFLKQLKSRFCR